MVLVLDKASWHMSKDTMKFFAARDIVLIRYLMGHTYLNPVEEVWNIIKKQLLPFSSVCQQDDATQGVLQFHEQ